MLLALTADEFTCLSDVYHRGCDFVCRIDVVSGLVSGMLLAFGVMPAAAKVEHHRDGRWVLKVRHDHFTGRTRCTLQTKNHRLQYQPGAVGFLIGKRRNTLPAWYRIDGGAPVRWQNRTASLIATGVAIDGPGLENPTGGWVWIPVSEVENAVTVAIRADEHARVRRYRLDKFGSMLASARSLGCSSDDAFRI